MLVKGSFEDLIYILIGVIWIAFSIYKGVQKRKAVSPSPEAPDTEEPPEKKKSVFDSFLSELMKEEEPAPYQPTEVEQQADILETDQEPKEEKLFSYDDVYEESNYLDETTVYKREPLEKPTLDQELKTHLSKRRKPRFDLRKAVIYSEILNKRYF